jgi:hypothetical protein
LGWHRLALLLLLRRICLCELGGTWVLSKDFLPFVTPLAGFGDLKAVLIRDCLFLLALGNTAKTLDARQFLVGQIESRRCANQV